METGTIMGDRIWTGAQWRSLGKNHHQNADGLVYYKYIYRTVQGYLNQGGSLDKIIWYNEQEGFMEHAESKINRSLLGNIYIISNPAWPGWVKIGKTNGSAATILNGYQRCSPLRDFVCHHFVPFTEYARAENEIHSALVNAGIKRNRGEKNDCEWFKCSVETALEIIERYKHETGL